MNLLAIISLLCIIESNNNPGAIGDNFEALGVLQIHMILVDDCNRILKKNAYTYSDRLDPELSKAMCIVIVEHYLGDHKLYNPESVARLWNSGPNWKNKKHLTNKYWAKVKKLIK